MREAIEIILRTLPELYFCVISAFGGQWATAFFKKEAVRGFEELIDFIFVCQGWLLYPFLIIIQVLFASSIPLAVAIMILWMTGLGILIRLGRHRFFSLAGLNRLLFKLFPILLVLGKITLEIWQPKGLFQTNENPKVERFTNATSIFTPTNSDRK